MVIPPESRRNVRVSMGWKLILPFVLLIVLVIAVFLPLSTRLIAQRLEQETDARLSRTAVSVGQLLEQAESRAQLTATLIANLPQVEAIGDDPQLAGQILPAQKDVLGLQELSYYSATHRAGQAVMFYGGPLIARRNLISRSTLDIRDALVIQVQANLTPVSGIAIAPQSSQIIGVAPVMANGQLSGIVMAVFFMDDSYVQQIGAVLDVDVAIVRDNAIIASSINPASGYETMLQEGFIASAPTPTRNIQYGDNIDRRMIASPLMIDGLNQGTILVVRSIQDVVDAQRQIQNVVLGFVAALIIVMVIYIIGVFLNFIRPLRRIADAASKVSGGQLSVRVPVPRIGTEDEVVELSRNFNTMTSRLEGLYTSLEQRVSERTHELSEALRELAVKRDEALEASRTKSLFLANMSHELRTPLNAIIGYSEMLEEEADDFGYEDIVPDLQKIQKAGKHLLALINDILDISKIEAGKIELYLEEFQLEDLLDEIVTTIQPVVEKNNNQLRFEADGDLGRIYSDMTRMRQIIFNLLSNAAKFTTDGVVTIAVRREIVANSEWLEIAVRDTGIGMNADQLKRVFQEFTQADASTTRKYGGTGLGLPISRHFCQMMGGDIAVSSVEGQGSTFTVRLPVRVTPQPGKRATNEIPAVARTAAHIVAENPVLSHSMRVLVIDDDPSVHELFARILSREGFEVLSAATGDEGLRMARELRPQVITLDVMMPSVDGWAVLSRLKADPEIGDIPVVMLSMIENRSLGFALGAVDYLTKPIDRTEVISVLQRFRRAGQAEHRVLIVEDDPEARELFRRTAEREGWQASEAENGRLGLAQLAIQIPDVILLDLMMPEIDGFQFIAEMRRNEAWRVIPIVVVTAKTLTEDDRAILNQSVERVLQKAEYTPNDLVLEIRHILETHRAM